MQEYGAGKFWDFTHSNILIKFEGEESINKERISAPAIVVESKYYWISYVKYFTLGYVSNVAFVFVFLFWKKNNYKGVYTAFWRVQKYLILFFWGLSSF